MRLSKLVTAERCATGLAGAGAVIELASLAAGGRPTGWGVGVWAFCIIVWTVRGNRQQKRLRKAYQHIELMTKLSDLRERSLTEWEADLQAYTRELGEPR